MAEDNHTTFTPKRSYESAFPQYGSEIGHVKLEEDEESSYWKRPRYAEGAELTSGEEGLSDEAVVPMDSYDGEAYDTPPGTAIKYEEGDSAYQATQNLDPHHYDYTTHTSSSENSPCSPADETWNWRSSHDATLAELCQKFSGSESFQIDPEAQSSSGTQLANSGLNYSYDSVAPQYYRADSGCYVQYGTENGAHVAEREQENASNTAGMYYTSNQVSAWSSDYYDPSVAGPSTYQGNAPQTFDDLELLTAVSSPPPITYFSDPSSSSLYYFDHHPPDSNNASVAPYAYPKDEVATPDLTEVTSVSQAADGMDLFSQEVPLDSIPDIVPGSVESFIFNTSTMEQFDGNANVESARERVGLGSDSVLPGMKATLMPHQITGVAWMLDKEDKDKGGCLGDEMGLGKTVQMIAVLVKNRSNDNSKKTTLIITPTSLLDQWKQELEIKTDCGLSCLIYHGSKRTKHANDLLQYDVVLTSYNTMSNEWPEADDSNSAERTTGRRRRSEAGPLFRLEFYRIVLDEAQSIRNKWTLTSRAVCDLKAVCRWCLTGTPIINTLMDVYGYLRFLRIEPWCDIHEFRSRIGEHEKKNPNLAAKRLQAILKSFLLRRKKDSTLDGKRLIELPEKTVDLVKLDFSPEEREIYNMVEARTQAKFNRFLRAGTVLKNYHQVLVLLLRLRQICSHPSLIQEEGMDSAEANGLSIDPVKEQTRAASLISPQYVEKIKRKFLDIHETRIQLEKESSRDAEVEDEECPICFDTLTDSVITACSHVFCRECIIEAIDHSRVPDSNDGGNKYGQGEKPCPVCRAAISKDKLFSCTAFEPPDESEHTKKGGGHTETSDKDAVESKIDAWTNTHCPPPSSKMKFMMQQLQKLMSECPEEKVLIVSQWTSCLSLVSKYLLEAGISHVNYRGDMDRTQRSQAVKDFTCNPDICVMLMSLKCGGVGLNLTRANHVISLDLGWSQAVEAQAFDRVHRLGQNRAVFVKRLAIANTVEDRVLQMQERKQALTDGSLGEGTGKKIKFSIRELANLFGLDQHGRVLESNYT